MEEGDEDDSDLHLAWSMLDIARSIDEKHCKPTLDTVKILSALGDVSLERGLCIYLIIFCFNLSMNLLYVKY